MELDNNICRKGLKVCENLSLTLLSSPVANTVSLLTRSSSLYLRLSSVIGGLALNGVRVTTLTGLEMSRAVMENILIRAGNDIAGRSSGILGKAEAEGLLEKSLITLHSTITQISFAASTGFYFSSAALASIYDTSQLLLTALDSILGSTDSSRAIASIIKLIRREFQNPATGQEGEKVGVIDLIVGVFGLAFLQRWCSKITESENNSAEIVWDVVVLDDGRRADFMEYNGIALVNNSLNSTSNTGGDHNVLSIDRGNKPMELSNEDFLEIMLRKTIMRELPPNATVCISNQVSTKIITVVVAGAMPPDLPPLPGVEITEQEVYFTKTPAHVAEGWRNELKIESHIPNYRTVYRVTSETGSTATHPKFSAGHQHVYQHKVDVVGPDSASIGEYISSGIELHLSQQNLENLKLDTTQDSPDQILHNCSRDIVANQKRSIVPGISSTYRSRSADFSVLRHATMPPIKAAKQRQLPTGKTYSIRNCIHKGSLPTSSISFTKAIDASISMLAPNLTEKALSFSSFNPAPHHNSASIWSKDIPLLPSKTKISHMSSLNPFATSYPSQTFSEPIYYPVRERNYISDLSQTQALVAGQLNEAGSEPLHNFVKQLKAQSLIRAESEQQISSLSSLNYRRPGSYFSGVYGARDNSASSSVIFSPQPSPSAFNDLDRLSRTGFADGLFPKHHLVKNITRYVRFASASYGSNFLRFMGISNGESYRRVNASQHYEHHSFSTHTHLPPSTILLSSFVDPQGGTDSSGHTNTGVPMVHYISLDHEFKAVVLTCRGTLGFEDVLTDMTCDYDEIMFHGKAFKVHKGIHASARRLLTGRVMATITSSLEEFPEYGLVMCGHSLGGAVSTLLAVMISEPDPLSAAFFTTSTPLMENQHSKLPNKLPKGRRVHVYAYGPPATMSPSLRIATRGLITTIVNHQDIVPYLSLGLLHDLQAVALAFKTDDTGTKSEVTKRVWQGMTGKFADVWYNRQGMLKDEDDQWAYSTLKALRACMLSTKLVPPGEVFVVETMPALQRDKFIKGPLGRPATRVVMRYVKDVEKWFGELRFGGSMLLDHSPGRYEASLCALGNGVLGR